MRVLSEIWSYFRDDPLRILSLLGGSGGLAYWVGLFRNRARIRPRLIEEEFYRSPARNRVRIEVVNLGKDPVSVEPIITLVGYTPRRQKREFILEVRSADRHLAPHAPKIVEADGTYEDVLPFLWFKRYRLIPTRGRAVELRIRSAAGTSLSRSRYIVELLTFRLVGRVKSEGRERARKEWE